ncbi:amidohydrolase family protein [Microbacterium chocolatum]|uniref:amidohydrolase n=1 Tax=Microbacterium aurantiacum TaxID=162393 RepID=UPI00338E0D1D
MTHGIGDQPRVVADVRLRAPERTDPFDDDLVDVHLAHGRIVDIAPAGALPRRGEVVDGAGRFLIPGLWDHHVHVTQWALVARRTDLAAASSAHSAADIMGRAPVLPDGRRVGTGFRDALWSDRPTRALLDAAGDAPTYLINADVHSVWLNSAAFRREGIAPTDDGILREEPAFEISRRLNAVDPVEADRLVSDMARRAAARGVVGIVDLDMAWNEESWARRTLSGFDALRIEFGIYPDWLDRAIAEGLRSGDPARGGGSDLARVGPLKVITDGSLGTRTAACSHPYPGTVEDRGALTVEPARLTDLMTRAAGAGIACAIHAIGDVANSHALDAFASTGAWGTIEHAQLVAHADIPRFARLGVGASVQPEHALDDRDMTDALWATQTAQPYPLRTLADAGANLLFGSDAPVAALDPWAAIAAAVHRTRGDRAPWQGHERVNPFTALAASTHGGSQDPQRIEPGARADLALCDTDPIGADERDLRAMRVSATLLGGRLTHVG